VAQEFRICRGLESLCPDVRQAGGAATVRAVFQPAREAEDASPGVYAVLFVRLVDLPGVPVRGDEVEIGGVRYKVFDIEADSEGAAVLKLRKSG